MLCIFMLKRAGERMLPCVTPISCSCSSDNFEPTLTLKCQWDKNPSIKCGRWTLKPKSQRSERMPCFHVVSQAFSRSKNMVRTCCFVTKASLMNVSKIQCGFRKHHSTLDHLLRFETFVFFYSPFFDGFFFFFFTVVENSTPLNDWLRNQLTELSCLSL